MRSLAFSTAAIRRRTFQERQDLRNGVAVFALETGDGFEAARHRLHFVGTLGVLRLAAKHGLVKLEDALARLLETNFYVSQDVLDRLLKDVWGI